MIRRIGSLSAENETNINVQESFNTNYLAAMPHVLTYCSAFWTREPSEQWGVLVRSALSSDPRGAGPARGHRLHHQPDLPHPVLPGAARLHILVPRGRGERTKSNYSNSYTILRISSGCQVDGHLVHFHFLYISLQLYKLIIVVKVKFQYNNEIMFDLATFYT